MSAIGLQEEFLSLDFRVAQLALLAHLNLLVSILQVSICLMSYQDTHYLSSDEK